MKHWILQGDQLCVRIILLGYFFYSSKYKSIVSLKLLANEKLTTGVGFGFLYFW